MKSFLTTSLDVAAGVLASLAGVWLLSQLIGFRFMPELVGAVSGSMAAVLILVERRRNNISSKRPAN